MSEGKEIKMTPSRLEVMKFLAKDMDNIVDTYLKSVDDNWQPADLLPVSNSETFITEIKELKEY